MRKLLQDKRFVGVMSVLAALLVAWRIGGSRLKGFLPSSESVAARAPDTPLVPPTPVPEPPADPAFAGAVASPGGGAPAVASPDLAPPSLAGALENWRDLFPDEKLVRDPFSGTAAEPEFVSPEPDEDLPPDTGPRLQAISVEPRQALAVIDREVLGVGDRIGEFEVERILAAEVWLKHSSGRRVLRLRSLPAARETPP